MIVRNAWETYAYVYDRAKREGKDWFYYTAFNGAWLRAYDSSTPKKDCTRITPEGMAYREQYLIRDDGSMELISSFEDAELEARLKEEEK